MCKHIITDPSLRSLAYNLSEKVNGNQGSTELRDDLLQELALIVCEKTDEELDKMSSYFNFWCVRTMIYMCGKRGEFTKKYGKKYYIYEDVNFDIRLEYDVTVDELIDKVEGILNDIGNDKNRGWYRKELFKTYLECGTFRAVERDVGINYVSVYNTVKEVKNHIKDKL